MVVFIYLLVHLVVAIVFGFEWLGVVSPVAASLSGCITLIDPVGIRLWNRGGLVDCVVELGYRGAEVVDGLVEVLHL